MDGSSNQRQIQKLAEVSFPPACPSELQAEGKMASATRETGIVTGQQIVPLMLERRRVTSIY